MSLLGSGEGKRRHEGEIFERQLHTHKFMLNTFLSARLELIEKLILIFRKMHCNLQTLAKMLSSLLTSLLARIVSSLLTSLLARMLSSLLTSLLASLYLSEIGIEKQLKILYNFDFLILCIDK
jgi:hypothetical protein